MNQKLRDDKDAIEAAHEAVSPEQVKPVMRTDGFTAFSFRSGLHNVL